MSPRTQVRHTLVVPVKTLSRAKSRLRDLPDDVRRELALAFALDAVSAAAATEEVAEVRVVTDEPDVAQGVRRLGAVVVSDLGGGDLNVALGSAMADVRGGPVAAMLGDLPCLEPDDLAEALRAAAGTGPCFVADHTGSGTTLLAVPRPEEFRSRFGPGSRSAHAALGLVDLPTEVPTLRLDVDTVEDLRAALDLGVGPHSRAAVRDARLGPDAPQAVTRDRVTACD